MKTLFASPEVEKLSETVVGIVEEAIAPDQPGRVKGMGTYWPARFYHSDCKITLKPNDRVSIVAMCGITLLVVPVGLAGQ